MFFYILGGEELESPQLEQFLREQPVEAIISAQEKLVQEGRSFSPVIDDRFLTACPQALYKRGQFAPVPVLAGVCASEGTLFLSSLMAGDNCSKEDAIAAVKFFFGRAFNDLNGGHVDSLVSSLQEYYFEGVEVDSVKAKTAASDAVGDMLLVWPTYKCAAYHCGINSCNAEIIVYKPFFNHYNCLS